MTIPKAIIADVISLRSHPILAILSHRRLKLEPRVMLSFLFVSNFSFFLFFRNSPLSLRFRILQQTSFLTLCSEAGHATQMMG